MRVTHYFKIGLSVSILFLISVMALSETQWKSLSNGIAYTRIAPQSPLGGVIHAFQIDLNRCSLGLLANKGKETLATNVVKSSGPILAINGGFFTPEGRPVGLRMNEGRVLSPFQNTSWLGIFMIKDHRATIIPKNAYRADKAIDMAIQAGPRLIVNGHIPSLTGSSAERSAIGITQQGKIIIAVTEHMLLTTTEFANILKKSESQNGLDCADALNLDGGSSSQLSARIGSFHLTVPSLRPVVDFVVVTGCQ